MSISAERKKEVIRTYAITTNDTGSTDVQCAVLTERINNLTEHFKVNKKDYASQRGLLMMVGRRRRLLKYLKSQSVNRYITLSDRLGLRKK